MIFFGSGNFGAHVLEALLKCERRPSLIVTQNDEHEVHVVATAAQCPLIAPTDVEDLRALLLPVPDHILVASFGEILPEWLFTIPTHGVLNIHQSLLPKYRGPSPLQTTITHGDTDTGVTLISIDAEMDHGPIISNAQFSIPNPQIITKPELENVLAAIGAQLYHDHIDAWIAGKITPMPQMHSLATYTKIIRREDGHIDWSQSAEVIDRLRRAYDPWPGIWTQWDGKRLKIIFATPTKGAPDMPFGTVLSSGSSGVAIVCGTQSMYQLHTVQLEGKRALSIQEFLRGQKNFIGSNVR